jgi:CheY-like chemotaxis protein
MMRTDLGVLRQGVRKRILVAEDDPEMRRVLVETLRGEGYDIDAVSDGGALLVTLARSDRFNFDAVDLVVSDVRMPLCSGMQALEMVRTLRPRLRFVLLTAFGDDELRAAADRQGALMLEKPFSLPVLRNVVARALLR